MKLEPDAKTGYLPPGVHHASWFDVVIGFGGNSHRLRLIEGLLAACRNLAHAGCKTVYLDGSFVSAKQLPNDYDGAWETADVDVDLLDPVLLDFTNQRAAMKAKYAESFSRLHSSPKAVCFFETSFERTVTEWRRA